MLLLLAGAFSAKAGGFSYIFIQGDKQVPFYIKFEDQMLPRYGKNYNIIPQLAPGAVNIQVLFQQNMYPAQKFTIVVPEDGFRGFLLMQKNGSFALYDIHQKFYLYPGNRAEDDQVPQANSYVYTNPAPTQQQQQQAQPAYTQVTRRTNANTANNREPRFIGNIELNNERTIQKIEQEERVSEEVVEGGTRVANESNQVQSIEEQPVEELPQANNNTYETNEPVQPPVVMVTNSDCPSAMTDAEFEDLYGKVQDKQEKQKLKFLLSKMESCYSTNQARVLAESLSNDPEKYTFLKRVFPRVTDQYNFPPLENLLSTQEWKSYFRLILPK